MKTATSQPLLLRGATWPMIRNLTLPALALAAVWVWADYQRYGRVPFATSVASSIMLAVGLIAAAAALVPNRLKLDDDGLSWTRWGRTQTFRWSEIEAVGLARPRGMEGLDGPVIDRLVGGATRRYSAPMIGLNPVPARSQHKEAVRRAQLQGYSGYEINIPPWFGGSAEQLVEEVRARWLLHRGSQQTNSLL